VGRLESGTERVEEADQTSKLDGPLSLEPMGSFFALYVLLVRAFLKTTLNDTPVVSSSISLTRFSRTSYPAG
jgi:hypothetical protein